MADTILFNRFCLLAKTTFNVNGSYNNNPVKMGILHEEQAIKHKTGQVYLSLSPKIPPNRKVSVNYSAISLYKSMFFEVFDAT
ncbi:hypothetical protein [Candidatus Enterovibrio escicola]|nr:hypothetical protein [Candidatus Enterovibrio escacola]